MSADALVKATDITTAAAIVRAAARDVADVDATTQRKDCAQLRQIIDYTCAHADVCAVIKNRTRNDIYTYGITIPAGAVAAFLRGRCIYNDAVSRRVFMPRPSGLLRSGILRADRGAEVCACCGALVVDSNVGGEHARRYIELSDGRIVYVCRSCAAALTSAERVVSALTAPRPYACNEPRAMLVESSTIVQTYNESAITMETALRGAFYKCPTCGKFYARGVAAPHGLCPTCADAEGFRRCDECGAWYQSSADGATDEYCPTCATSHQYDKYIHRYHNAKCKGMTMYNDRGKVSAAVDVDAFRGVGIELEINAADDVSTRTARRAIARAAVECGILDDDRATLEEDCSVDGCELITAPHTIGAFKNVIAPRLAAMCKKLLRGGDVAETHEKTGLHVHVSRNLYHNDPDALARLLYLFAANADGFNALSRRGDEYRRNEYARPLDAWIGNIDDAQRIADRDTFDTRYCAINLENCATIEFRLWQGALDIEYITNVVDTCYYLTARAVTMDDAHAADVATWLNGAPDNVISFMRGAFTF